VGGLVALAVQGGAVLILRPAMRGPQREFVARWLAGMALRFVGALGWIAFAATHRDRFPLLPAALGYLMTLLPLLLTETKFLK
jgi:hypothetical protein